MTKIYAAMEDELLVISGGDGVWETERKLEGVPVQSVAADPVGPERVYCASGRGLWRSVDGGGSWERVRGVPQSVTAVAVSPVEKAGDHGVVYAGIGPAAALYRSEDGGESWRELEGMRELPSEPTWSFPPAPETSHVRWISPDPLVSGRVFVAIEAGALVRTLDGGETWEDRTADGPIDTHTLAEHAAAPGRLYSAAGDGFMQTGRGYAESPDAGLTWERFADGLDHHYLWSVAVDPADPDMILVSAAASPWQAHNPRAAASTVYRKTAGEPWKEVREGLPGTEGRTVAVLAANEAEPGVFYCLANTGLYRSPDAGLTWERLDLTWRDGYPRQHGLLVVGAG